jgi:DNA-binding XRE family transcriptional regulator
VTAKRHALAERRQIVGHSQETLARVVGVEPTTVGRWERGETCPQPWCRPKLADALGVSLEELDTMLAEGQPVDDERSTSSEPQGAGELPVDPEHDPVLAPRWNHHGTVEAAAVLRGGDGRVERRGFVFLTGMALTAPAHQWLVHEPGPLVSGLSGHRMSPGLVDRLTAMIAELRKMDDVAGGGSVLALAQHEFSWVAGLLNHARYDERTGRGLHVVLAELGQLCGWSAHDTGHHGLAQRYYVTALRTVPMTGPWARTSSRPWPVKQPVKDGPRKPSRSSKPPWLGREDSRRQPCSPSCISSMPTPWRACGIPQLVPRLSPRLAPRWSTSHQTMTHRGCTG